MEITRLIALHGGMDFSLWAEAKSVDITVAAKKFLIRVGINPYRLVELKKQGDDMAPEIVELLKAALKDSGSCFNWFLVGAAYLGILLDHYPELRMMLNLEEPQKPTNQQIRMIKWRFILQSSGVEIGVLNQLTASMTEIRRTSNQLSKFNLIFRTFEILREQATQRDEKDRNQQQMEPKINAAFYGDVFGIVNLGEITGHIYNSTTLLAQTQGGKDLAEALRGLTEAVETSNDLEPKRKKEALELVETLSEQASLPPDKRKPASFRSALNYLPTVLSTVVSGIKIWETFGPAIESYFKLL